MKIQPTFIPGDMFVYKPLHHIYLFISCAMDEIVILRSDGFFTTVNRYDNKNEFEFMLLNTGKQLTKIS